MNYVSTFIEVAEDCPVTAAVVPEGRGGKKTIAALQYELVAGQPYEYTQEDVQFLAHAAHKSIPASEWKAERERFFAKSQACFRASPLGKRYGWGVHCDEHGRMALVAVESEEYRKLAEDPDLAHLKAVRSKRAGR